MRIVSNKIFRFIASAKFSSSRTLSSFGAAFCNSTQKMELFENVIVIMHDDVHNAFITLSHIFLDVCAAEISPQQTACLRLIESIGKVLSLLNYCSSNQCIQSDELIYQKIKMALSFFLLIKPTSPALKDGLNCVIKPDNCPLSSRDRQSYKDLFKHISLSWLHYYTLKNNVTFK